MFSLRSSFIGLTTGAATMAMVAAAEAQEPQIEPCDPFHYTKTICDPATKSPIAIFNQCRQVTTVVGAIDPATGNMAVVAMTEFLDDTITADDKSLEDAIGLEKANPQPDSVPFVAELEKGRQGIAKAKKGGLCFGPSS